MKCERVRSQAESLGESFLLPRLGNVREKISILKPCSIPMSCRIRLNDVCQHCEEYLLLIRVLYLLKERLLETAAA